jgi:NAD(P)-dependent dehydrogenase (short-subunit alcohol dehydrogenase family)
MYFKLYQSYQPFQSYVEPQRFSKDGHEEHMQVNHLAPALLAMLLIPSLLRGSPSRIVNVNSIVSSLSSPLVVLQARFSTMDANIFELQCQFRINEVATLQFFCGYITTT